jgi:hypothetical protein
MQPWLAYPVWSIAVQVTTKEQYYMETMALAWIDTSLVDPPAA